LNVLCLKMWQAGHPSTRTIAPTCLQMLPVWRSNRLPARYVRHDVDMMFYLTEKERHAIDESVNEALAFAFSFVGERMAMLGRSR
jgi:hypothetical protein